MLKHALAEDLVDDGIVGVDGPLHFIDVSGTSGSRKDDGSLKYKLVGVEAITSSFKNKIKIKSFYSIIEIFLAIIFKKQKERNFISVKK